ncbi:hypothetical protein AVEN_49976-1 [Araneus ventricosus]|uniref:Uncharacterized protein n=1 Tax=Araneus ventricosus TaxID=182803 RepID=A0A4Y2QZ31_ARAVE|nr:hypothetical protein AVEN_49976-1 [Araneus ventricosus]
MGRTTAIAHPSSRALLSTRANAPTPTSDFKTGLPQWFCGLRFRERAPHSPYIHRSHFCFMAWHPNRCQAQLDFQNFDSTAPIFIRFSPCWAIWSSAPEFVRCAEIVNVQL